MRVLLLPALLLLAACGALTNERRIGFATVQTLNPGVDGRWILQEYPEVRRVTRRPDGRLERLEYGVNDPQGRSQQLVLHFDEHEILSRKEYSGRLVRPLDPDAEAGKGLTGKPRGR